MESITTREGLILSIAATMLGNDISGNNHSCSLTAPKRSARSRTCCALSSAVTYKVGPAVLARSCNNNVLLPMPGSPPNNVTEPGTSPPPRTRSNSPIPVERGLLCCVSTFPMGVASPGGTSARPAANVTSESSGPSTSSTREFQAPHAKHFPDHFGKEAPHSEQR